METTIYYPEQHPEVTVVEIHGDVAAGEAGCDVLCRITSSLIAGGDRFVVVDLLDAGRVDEEAIAQLLAIYGRLRLRGGHMVIAAPPGDVLKALRAVGFDRLALIVDNVDTAIQQAAMKAGATQ